MESIIHSETVIVFSSFLLLLLAGALSAAAETAFQGLPASRVRLELKNKNRHALHLKYWLDDPGVILTTLNLVRVLAFIAGGAVGPLLAQRFGFSPTLPVGISISVFAFFLFGHLLPRAAGKRYSLGIAGFMIRPIRVLAFFLQPLVVPLNILASMIAKRMGGSGRRLGAYWTPDEVGLVADKARAGTLGESNEDLLHSIIEFSDTVIREIMVPRTQMISLDIDAPLDEIRSIIINSRHSRIPVFDDTIDNIEGVLYVKDLFTQTFENGQRAVEELNIRELARETFYVPEVMKISELLGEFQRRKIHLAVVVDEYGGTAGIVTLEDIIEEIVGEIQDEFDLEENQYRQTSDGKIIADGRVRIWDLEEPLNHHFPDDGTYETLAGFLTAQSGYLPSTGTVISWEDLRFSIKEADERRITTVEISRAGDVAKKA
ncbi:HlyC/CorC family transporter [Myxococcota bacterium]|nr:HlyC/CorC family transporter [Myxococcota bacterium]